MAKQVLFGKPLFVDSYVNDAKQNVPLPQVEDRFLDDFNDSFKKLDFKERASSSKKKVKAVRKQAIKSLKVDWEKVDRDARRSLKVDLKKGGQDSKQSLKTDLEKGGQVAKQSLKVDLEKGVQDAQPRCNPFSKYAADLRYDPTSIMDCLLDFDELVDDSVPEDLIDNSFSFDDLTNNYYRGLIEMMDADSSDDADLPVRSWTTKYEEEDPEVVLDKKERLIHALSTLDQAAALEYIMTNRLLD